MVTQKKKKKEKKSRILNLTERIRKCKIYAPLNLLSKLKSVCIAAQFLG